MPSTWPVDFAFLPAHGAQLVEPHVAPEYNNLLSLGYVTIVDHCPLCKIKSVRLTLAGRTRARQITAELHSPAGGC